MVSFDVVSPFTSMPTELACQILADGTILKEFLEPEDSHHWTTNQLLIFLCYFQIFQPEQSTLPIFLSLQHTSTTNSALRSRGDYRCRLTPHLVICQAGCGRLSGGWHGRRGGSDAEWQPAAAATSPCRLMVEPCRRPTADVLSTRCLFPATWQPHLLWPLWVAAASPADHFETAAIAWKAIFECRYCFARLVLRKWEVDAPLTARLSVILL